MLGVVDTTTRARRPESRASVPNRSSVQNAPTSRPWDRRVSRATAASSVSRAISFRDIFAASFRWNECGRTIHRPDEMRAVASQPFLG